ncbi:formin-mediated actin nucleation enhancer, partial [Ascoidea rubescens DSM 1968]
LSTIESNVTRLLVATKHLLNSLTQWAKLNASEKDVSDAYVELGNNFKLSCKAFSAAGVDVSDLGDVPYDLRVVLESALCEPASQETLDKFLPKIREIIVRLLNNLKKKQHYKNEIKQRSASYVSPPTRHRYQASYPMFSNQQQSPESSDALVQLQNGDSLKRRASRRFSAYQYAKLGITNSKKEPLPKDAAIALSNSRKSLNMNNNVLNNAISNTSNIITTATNNDGSNNQLNNDKIILFLKLHQRVKKVTLDLPINFNSLRLLFIEKFAYSPGSDSIFPDLYIQESLTEIPYELEEQYLSEIRNNSIISLNTAAISGIESKHFDSHFNNKTDLQGLNNKLSELKNEIKATNTEQQVTAPGTPTTTSINIYDYPEISDIRHELMIIKQIQKTNKDDFTSVIESLLKKVKDFKSIGFSGSQSSNRAYMENCHTKLSNDSDFLLTKVDDLQDVIEALRKDVAVRGARPSPKQLTTVSKDIQAAREEIDKMNGYIVAEKTTWKKIWEKELDTVCDEQQFFNLQEILVQDLTEDLDKCFETFSLVEQCTKQQEKRNRTRQLKPMLKNILEPGESISDVRDAVLGEVASLVPNHENRLAAIKKAERLREKNKKINYVSQFQEELNGFVGGKKLKKSGGIEEAERLRKEKDELNLKTVF